MSLGQRASLILTISAKEDFLAIRLPPLSGVQSMHLGKMKKSAQSPRTLEATAFSSSLPQTWANILAWLPGTRFTSGVLTKHMSMRGTEKDLADRVSGASGSKGEPLLA